MPLMQRLREKRTDQTNFEPFLWKTRPFIEPQLRWIEEYPDYWINVLALPQGSEFELNSEWNRIQIKDLGKFIFDHPSENLWRSWDVWHSFDSKSIIGPIPYWIDIDDKNQNLQNSFTLTRVLVNLLLANEEWAENTESVRVAFSGKKGFHIYAKPPSPIDGEITRQKLIALARKELNLGGADGDNVFWDSTILDVSHEEIRIIGSVHSWYDESQKLKARRTFTMSSNEFLYINLNEILRRSETPS